MRALLSRAREAAARWARKRQGADAATVTLHRRRLYILPTRLGLTYAVMLMAMLVGGLNYGSNPALAFTFLFAAAGWVAMHQCHANLLGVQCTVQGTAPVFAGDTTLLTVVLSAPPGRIRQDLVVSVGEAAAQPVTLTGNGSATVQLPLPATRRGEWPLPRLRIAARFPLGLFVSWTWVHPPTPMLVYPSVERSGPPAPATGDGGTGRGAQRGEDEYAGLRAFRDGDSPRRIAWRPSARRDAWLVVEHHDTPPARRILDYAAAAPLGHEARLSRLARWALACEAAGLPYALHAPWLPPSSDQAVGALGPGHLAATLRALALAPGP